jgi:phage terminase small subunit
MAALENARHERFCQEVAKGQPAYKAYIAAGYSENGARPSASALLTNPNVSARIDELKAALEKRTGYTQARIAEMLEEDRKLARELGQASAATAATIALGKLHGHFVEKHEHKITVTHEERMQRAQSVLTAYRHVDRPAISQ